jgi:hypothetical protein
VFEKLGDRLNLPVVNRHFKITKSSRSVFENLLTLENGDVLLGNVSSGKGSVFLLTAPLSQTSSNMARHALFVPTIYRICFSSLKAASLFYVVKENNVLTVKNDAVQADQPPHIRQTDKQADIIPEVHPVENSLLLYTRSQITQPGFYEIVKSNVPVMPLAFNYSRKESDLSCYTPSEIQTIINGKGWKNFRMIENSNQDISKQVLEEAQGKKLWKLFIILALGFIIIEILLLRFLK